MLVIVVAAIVVLLVTGKKDTDKKEEPVSMSFDDYVMMPKSMNLRVIRTKPTIHTLKPTSLISHPRRFWITL